MVRINIFRKVSAAVCAVCGLLLSLSCATQPVVGVKIVERHRLNKEVAETSGLWCDEQSMYTLNDSGNAPVLYQLNTRGQIEKRFPLDVSNRDWEALAGDEHSWYVADIGNNSGRRKDIFVYKVPRHKPEEKITTLKLQYQQATKKIEPYAHDRDAEALVTKGNQLVMFSKSWRSNILHVYILDKEESTQQLVSRYDVEGLPGMVTGAAYVEKSDHYVLVGYDGRGLFTPFIARLGGDFSLFDFQKLPSLGQVEGVCVRPNGEVWLTQESSLMSSAKLVNVEFKKPYPGGE